MHASASNPDTRVSAGLATGVPGKGLLKTCAVRLFDRRTGQVHRINGRPLVLFTKTPDEAAAELLTGRNAALWEVRIDPIAAHEPTPEGAA